MNTEKLQKARPRPHGYPTRTAADQKCHRPKTKFFAAVFGVAGTLFAAMPAASAWTAVVYKDKDFKGSMASLNEGSYTRTQMNAAGMSNDAITSLRIKPGYKIVLYRDDNFGGETATYFWDDKYTDKSGMNDQASSIKVVKLATPYTDSSVYRVYSYDDVWKRHEILKRYAPRLEFDYDENYMPSSLEWNANFTTRKLKPADNKYIREANESMPDSIPAKKLAYFTGNYDSRTTYAFWSNKSYDCIDLSYWTFYPYNLGKNIEGTEVGNHVGDWEHVTVRLIHWEYNGGHYIRPTNVCYQAHNIKNLYGWDDGLEKRDGTHPVVYVSGGSHGVWKSAGDHVYLVVAGVYTLKDFADGNGREWNTWESGAFKSYEYDRSNSKTEPLGGTADTNVWDAWDYDDAGRGACVRWGNDASTTTLFGQERRSDGPSGPEQKAALKAASDLE